MPDEPDIRFEEALSQLERIVASLERGEPELTSALAKYEKGVLLLTQCHRLLDQAEQSVALLTGVDDEGNPLTAPFDATATIAREAGTDRSHRAPSSWPNPPKKRKTSDRPSTPRTPAPPSDDPTQTSDPPF